MMGRRHGESVRARGRYPVRAFVLLAGAGLLAGCTATAGPDAPAVTVSSAAAVGGAASPTAGPTANPASPACGTATPELLADIAVNARPEGTFTPLTGAFVEADNGIYVVAVRFEGLDAEVLEGVWTAVGVDPATPPYLSADEDANLYTAWDTVLGMPGFGVALDDAAISAALSCLPR